MPSPDVLDLPALLAPIPGDTPTGADLRANAAPTSPYYQVKDARSAAPAAERRIESGAEDAAPPDWKAVVAAATKALTAASKDLEVAAYLIEGLARTSGFAGLRDGFKLARGLVEQFWDGLYPTPDEEGVLTKVAPLAGLNGDDAEGTLLAPIRTVPFTESANHGRLSYANYLQALATSKVADPKARDKKIADGAMSFAAFRAAVDETPAAHLRIVHDDLTGCLDEFEQMTAALDKAAGASSPPASAIRTALTAVLDALKDVARDKLAITQTAAPAADATPSANGKPADAKADDGEGGERLPTVRSREDALNAILKLADYFRRTEPHSLVTPALEQAVRWGRMPVSDLLAELIPDDDARKALFRHVGIRGGEPAADGDDEADGGKKKKR